MHMLWD